MATGNIWDEYQQTQQPGWTPPPGIGGNKAQPKITPGNKSWQDAQSSQGKSTDPVQAASLTPQQSFRPQQSNFPAANNFMQGNPSGAMTSVGAPFQPANIPATNDYKPGSIGSNIGSTLGQSFTNPYASMFNQQPQQQQPTLTGYHWYAGTGGVSGGNNAFARYNWSDNTTTREPAGSQYQFPRLGLTRQDQPSLGTPPDQSQAPAQYPVTPQGNINFNVPGGSMQDALQKLGSSGNNYNASTGSWLNRPTY